MTSESKPTGQKTKLPPGAVRMQKRNAAGEHVTGRVGSNPNGSGAEKTKKIGNSSVTY